MPYTMEQMQQLAKQKTAQPPTQPMSPPAPQQPMTQPSPTAGPSGSLTMEQMQTAVTKPPQPLPDGMPQIKKTEPTSPMEWFKSHPWMTAASATLGPLGPASIYATAHPIQTAQAAADLVKSIPSLGVQLPKTAAGSALQLPEDIRSYVTGTPVETEGPLGEAKKLGQELMQPTSVPVLGEVKNPSAVPGDIQASNTQTPLETGLQALDIGLSGPSAMGAKSTVKGVTKALEKRAANKAEKVFADYIAPKLTASEKEALLAKSRSKKFVDAAAKRTAEVVELARGVVDPKLPADQNIARIGERVEQVSNIVGDYLKTNIKPFNQKTFAANIRKTPVPAGFKGDQVMAKTYENVVKMAEEVATQFGGTRFDAWRGRIEFDRRAAEAFGDKVLQGNPQVLTPAKQAIRDVRGKWNEFIAKDMPDETFQKGMKDLSRLIELSEDLAYKYRDEVGKLPETFLQKHPYIKKAIILGGKSALVGAAGMLGIKGAENLIPGE